MTIQRKIAAIACALSCTVSTQALAHSPSTDEEIATLRAELVRLSTRLGQLEAELAETNQTASAATDAAVAATEVAAVATEVASGAADTAARAEAAANEPAPEIAFKGAPQISDDNGWSFKPRGRANIDMGFVSAPESTGADSGFDAEARRIPHQPSAGCLGAADAAGGPFQLSRLC